MTNERIILGKKGEELVAHWLQKAGFTISEKNYVSSYGEIDIIAHKQELLVFVEVKLRQNPLFNVSEVITPTKQKKIIKTALWYIARHNFYDTVYRFDVALLEPAGADYTITYIENAFTASSLS